ncbi:hypothetical protein [Streptomyces sp. NPDC055036]
MIHTPTYRLVLPPDQPEAPSGISVDVPVLRKRVLRTAVLTPDQEHQMSLLHGLLDVEP